MSLFIDLHPVQSVPPSCINRDDSGSPKTAVFGGVQRHRVSSQSWKAATRRSFASAGIDADLLGSRSKHAPARVADLVYGRTDLDRDDDADAKKVTKEIATVFEKVLKIKKIEDGGVTGAITFLSRADLDVLADIIARRLDGEKITDSAMKKALAGPQSAIDVALFGRMFADAPEPSVDASCQVAHAISVNRAVADFDYFTAVADDRDSNASAMIGVNEFMSSVLYRYATINVDQLVSNLGDVEVAAVAVEAFVTAYLTSMPTGKQNSYANRTLPDFTLAEVRSDQPASLVNAFETPVTSDGHITAQAAEALVTYAADVDKAFGTSPDETLVVTTDRAETPATAEALTARGADRVNLPDLATRLGDAVRRLAN